jgi:hypothetical protein
MCSVPPSDQWFLWLVSSVTLHGGIYPTLIFFFFKQGLILFWRVHKTTRVGAQEIHILHYSTPWSKCWYLICPECEECYESCVSSFFFYGTTARCRALASLMKRLLFRGLIPGFETFVFFTVRGRQPLAQPPTWRTRVSLLVWIIPFDLSGMGGSTSSYATAGIALRVIWPCKPHHYVKVETPSGGCFFQTALI